MLSQKIPTSSLRLISSLSHRPRIHTHASHLRPASAARNSRRYATPTRKAITVTNDDGRVRWGELSTREKAARTTQQSFNFTIVLLGVVATGAVFTALYLDVFSPNSTTSYFNHSTSLIKAHAACIDALGPPNTLSFFGEATWNKWKRNRPIASRVETDRRGAEHMYLEFNVEGEHGNGRVFAHLAREKGESSFGYKYLFVDVSGGERIWVEKEDGKGVKKSGKVFGVKLW